MSESHLSPTTVAPLPHPLIPQEGWQSYTDDKQSKGSDTSFRTVLHPSSHQPSSTRSRASLPSTPPPKNENAPLSQFSQPSLLLVSSANSTMSPRRVSTSASHKSSWRYEVPLPSRLRSPSLFLLDPNPLEGLDPNVGSTQHAPNSTQDLGHDEEEASDNETSFDIKKEETLSTVPSRVGQDSGAVRPVNLTYTQRSKVDHTFKKLAIAFGPKRTRSLTVRQERWVLDDFDERKPVKLDLPEQRQVKRHQKASSWASFGFASTAKRAAANLGVARVETWTHKKPRSRFLSSNRSSRLSNAAEQANGNASQPTIQDLDQAAWDRAVHRRKIIEELISSEESYIADLKVLLHVSSLQKLFVENRTIFLMPC